MYRLLNLLPFEGRGRSHTGTCIVGSECDTGSRPRLQILRDKMLVYDHHRMRQQLASIASFYGLIKRWDCMAESAVFLREICRKTNIHSFCVLRHDRFARNPYAVDKAPITPQ
ncbi:hypothetical protein BASA61_003172 [Batrachochytrium salamandrivorans]|nr:hypothetical protein BASA61_003172 [Batrachochytrium salamandrivorans]